MRRRRLLAGLGGIGVTGVIGAGGVAAVKPEIVIGSPRAEGEPTSTEQTIRDDSIEYRSSSDTIRYPTRMQSDGPAAYETEPFDRWADRRCASVGSESILPAIADRFERELRGIGKGVTSEYIGLVITVSATTTRNREGEVVSEPTVSLQTLVDRTPRTVHTTITLDGRSHSRSVPVFVEESEVSHL